MFKRIALFFMVNFLVIVTVSVVLNVLGVQPYLSRNGIDYGSLLVFCFVWGMGGAFVSLAISRFMAKRFMGVKLITESDIDSQSRWIVQTVHAHARKAGLGTMPEVGVFESPDPNAFATGPTKSRSLVAVSTGLMSRMSRDEVDGVIAHEVAHIANGDMVTMALLQGVVNAFVMFFARIVAFAISSQSKEDGRRSSNHLIVFLLELVFGFLGMMVVAKFSRYREFRADAGGAKLAGRNKMTAALQKLQASYGLVQAEENASIAAFKISNKQSGFAALFSTHPPLEERIARLQSESY